MSEENTLLCYKCKKELTLEVGMNVSRSEECPHCYADLRCCKTCQFYDKSSYNECREPNAPRIVEKEKSNFCDFFKIGNANSAEVEKNDLLSAADALFKK